ncbi:MAG: hypothetical protein HFH46_00375 [Bacilli bacterium]|nr:hypothetical protein [Bacilli bacterium]MCI9585505.1 hypothetical protein [Bacilli bacterium]
MLEKDRFLDIKEMAKNVRKDNETLFAAFEQESAEDAIREKDEFIETIIDSMDIDFSEGELGKEEKQIFRANVLIPDDDEFFETYSKDKNIRNLMKHYAVSIEDIMSKITELNIYSAYLEDDDSSVQNELEAELQEETKDKNESFVDTMVNFSTKDAESLLDEIENLSQAMEGLNITSDDDDFDFNFIKEEKDEETDMPNIEIEKEDLSYSSDMSIDDISVAVDGFVDDYNTIQTDLKNLNKELDKNKKENEKLQNKIKSLREEAYEVQKNNLESAKSLKEARKQNELLENENITLKEQVKHLEEQLKRSSVLLKKIYNSIPRK